MSADHQPPEMCRAFLGESPDAARRAASEWLSDFSAHGPLEIVKIRTIQEGATFVATVTYSAAANERVPSWNFSAWQSWSSSQEGDDTTQFASEARAERQSSGLRANLRKVSSASRSTHRSLSFNDDDFRESWRDLRGLFHFSNATVAQEAPDPTGS